MAPNASRAELAWYVGIRLFSGLGFVFLLVPIFIMLPFSFSSGSYLSYPIPGFSFKWYVAIAEPFPWVSAFKNSLMVGSAAAFLATALGTLAAYGLTMTNFPGKSLVYGILISPLAVPLVVAALAFYFFFAATGLIGTFAGLVLAHTTLGVPFVVITVAATLSGLDPNCIRAAESLGASPITAFRTITLPLILPGVATGAVFAFITSWDEIIVALFVSGPEQFTLPRRLFMGVRDHLDPSVVAVAAFLITVSVLLMLAVELLRWASGRRR